MASRRYKLRACLKGRLSSESCPPTPAPDRRAYTRHPCPTPDLDPDPHLPSDAVPPDVPLARVVRTGAGGGRASAGPGNSQVCRRGRLRARG